MGDLQWHKLLAGNQQNRAAQHWITAALSLDSNFQLLLCPGAWSCASTASREGDEPRREDELEACPDSLRGKAVELEVGLPFAEGISPKLTLGASCEGVTIGAALDFEVSAGIAEFGVGPFGEVEIAREGDVTVFITTPTRS